MTKALTTFVTDERGVDLIEYALLAGLIGIAAVTAITGIGTQVNRILGAVNPVRAGLATISIRALRPPARCSISWHSAAVR